MHKFYRLLLITQYVIDAEVHLFVQGPCVFWRVLVKSVIAIIVINENQV